MSFIKLRKNAKAITAFIKQAKSFSLNGQSMGLDDCYRSTGSSAMGMDEVLALVSVGGDWYGQLYVTADTDEQGNITYMTLSKCKGYHWADEIVVSMYEAEPVEEEELSEADEQLAALLTEPMTEEELPAKQAKPHHTFAEVTAALLEGYISPLNHGAKHAEPEEDQDKKIVSVKVIWSESGHFNSALLEGENFDINKTISMEEYARLAWLTVNDYADGEGGYHKTKTLLTLGSGQQVIYRHDICPKEAVLSVEWAAWVDYCRAQENKQA